ncbi:hypothetical protein OS493_008306 [Desmophyllum pertusum]|uniref:Uncharacterized protein n=1 Tax=Desmophyllum pertusum TaxID=174260 RepID=A0A9X0A424_9CNID|nr:hypothetical protein OS493_008306 [Desmophyllum pertusum]
MEGCAIQTYLIPPREREPLLNVASLANYPGNRNPASPKTEKITPDPYQLNLTKTPPLCSTPTKETQHKRSRDKHKLDMTKTPSLCSTPMKETINTRDQGT